MANESLHRIPEWARQLAWFLGKGSPGMFAYDGDFGYNARLESAAKRIWGHHIGEDVINKVLEYPFQFMLDDQNLNLVLRMRLRMATAKQYQLYIENLI